MHGLHYNADWIVYKMVITSKMYIEVLTSDNPTDTTYNSMFASVLVYFIQYWTEELIQGSMSAHRGQN